VIIAWAADVALMGHQVKWTDILGTVMILFFTFVSTIQKSGLLSRRSAKNHRRESSEIDLTDV